MELNSDWARLKAQLLDVGVLVTVVKYREQVAWPRRPHAVG